MYICICSILGIPQVSRAGGAPRVTVFDHKDDRGETA